MQGERERERKRDRERQDRDTEIETKREEGKKYSRVSYSEANSGHSGPYMAVVLRRLTKFNQNSSFAFLKE